MTYSSHKNGMPEISFTTCVSDWQLFENSVVATLKKMQSPEGFFELIPIDNARGQYSAAQALNLGLKQSTGKLIVICHQDVLFPQNWVSCLFEKIKEVEKFFQIWGVIGLAGRCGAGSHSGHVIDPNGEYFHPPLPRQVQTIDELCMVIRKNNGLRFDEYFNHFHLYGADLCLTAASKNMPCFTVDCCLEHLSGGHKGNGWGIQKERLIKKWWPNRHLVGNKVYTTSGTIRLYSPAVRIIRRIRDHLKIKNA
jgi:hypothetical protein